MRRRLVAAGMVFGAFVGACVAITGADQLVENACVQGSCATFGDAAMAPSDGDAGGPSVVCPGGAVACLGRCIDPATDTANCGACGHSCLGGSCVSSACQPVTLATVGGALVGIAVSATNVYYTLLAGAPNGLVGAVPLDGGPTTTIVTSQNNPRHVAVDAQHVYWVETGAEGRVTMANLDGTNRIVLASALNDPWDLTVDGTTVYWAVEGGGDAGPGSVQACSIAACLQPTTTVAGRNRPSGIVTAGNAVYWTEHVNSGGIYTCPKTGCSGPVPVELAPGQNSPGSITIGGSSLDWVTDGDGTVATCSIAGCTARQLAAQGDSSGGYSMPVAADESNVYWTDQGDLTIRSCAIAGCGGKPKILATGQSSAGIAVDATAIYWTDFVRGTVMRLAK